MTAGDLRRRIALDQGAHRPNMGGRGIAWQFAAIDQEWGVFGMSGEPGIRDFCVHGDRPVQSIEGIRLA